MGELLGMAKNRLQKFYNPKLHKPEAEPVLAQVQAHAQRSSNAPAPPPATWGAYQKSGESSGVMAMVDLLIKDLDKEMTGAEVSEKDAQADYEKMMAASADKRKADASSVSEKNSAKAELEGALEDHKDKRMDAAKELMATMKYIQQLHAECDWLVKYFDVRKEARDSEIDSLSKAKAVLSGADYSLLQTE